MPPPTPEPRAIYQIGNKELDKADRLALATWSGQTVPSHGTVYLSLTADQRVSLATVLRALGK